MQRIAAMLIAHDEDDVGLFAPTVCSRIGPGSFHEFSLPEKESALAAADPFIAAPIIKEPFMKSRRFICFCSPSLSVFCLSFKVMSYPANPVP